MSKLEGRDQGHSQDGKGEYEDIIRTKMPADEMLGLMKLKVWADLVESKARETSQRAEKKLIMKKVEKL